MDNINQTTQLTPIPESKNIFKYLFFIFFILFLIVTSVLITILITKDQNKISSEISQNNRTISESPKNASITTPTTEPTPNSKIYQNSNFKITFNYPLDWENSANNKEIPNWMNATNSIYKKSVTQTYPDKNFPLDGYISLFKIDNPKNLTVDQIFEQEYQECERNQGEDPGMGCGKTGAVSKWESYTVNGVQGFRAKIQAPESIEADEIYFKFDKYYLVLSATPYNENYKNELGNIFTEIIRSIKFNI